MPNEKLEAMILIEDGEMEIELKGLWTRALVDRAFVAVKRKLPAHLHSFRKEEVSEPIQMKEKSNERRTSKK